MLRYADFAKLKYCTIAVFQYADRPPSRFHHSAELGMKKHPEADALAVRLAAAANQPPAIISFPVTEPSAAETQKPVDESSPVTAVEQPRRRSRRQARSKTQASNEVQDDTHAISLRPRREVWTRYVLAAADRTRETGRVTSAQEIMLERLEGGP
jgi:hypothetical protein